MRWNTFQSEFDFDIKKIIWKDNWEIDALSRKLYCIYEVQYSRVEPKSLEKVEKYAHNDSEYTFLW